MDDSGTEFFLAFLPIFASLARLPESVSPAFGRFRLTLRTGLWRFLIQDARQLWFSPFCLCVVFGKFLIVFFVPLSLWALSFGFLFDVDCRSLACGLVVGGLGVYCIYWGGWGCSSVVLSALLA